MNQKRLTTVASFTYRADGMRKTMTTASGKPVSMTRDGKTYYYQLNGHGDVIALAVPVLRLAIFKRSSSRSTAVGWSAASYDYGTTGAYERGSSVKQWTCYLNNNHNQPKYSHEKEKQTQ
ncbi:hypothetical protein C8P63_1301 [Melghirimyces profundicolus]|uniref:Uncharacterized protein n=1 Tax=Melghirimyces profundicolus TaxID=1242148 RepID=A0A2T6B9E8_9BACL|nr:hypothetical protein [Melghirimyces profundicolus]PTX52689.1 hypothetical protein C8P63_1301 [Melghirimyces profundicolus]